MPNLIYEKKVVESTFSPKNMQMETKEEIMLRVHTLPNDGEFNRYMVSFYSVGVKTEEYVERLHFREDNAQTNFLEDLIATAMRLKTPYRPKNLVKK